MTLFLLGPARNLEGSQAPLELRSALAKRLRGAGYATLVMEEAQTCDGENHFAKFRRLVNTHAPITYLILVPTQARLHGLSVEIGHLLTCIQEGRLPATDVHLMLQSGLGTVADDGTLALHEPQNRTRYYADLIDEGSPLHRWRTVQELTRHAVAVAMGA